MKLMKIPVDNYNNLLTLLKLEHYGPMFEYFDYYARKNMSIYIVNNALENETLIPTQEHVCISFQIIDISFAISVNETWIDVWRKFTDTNRLIECWTWYRR